MVFFFLNHYFFLSMYNNYIFLLLLVTAYSTNSASTTKSIVFFFFENCDKEWKILRMNGEINKFESIGGGSLSFSCAYCAEAKSLSNTNPARSSGYLFSLVSPGSLSRYFSTAKVPRWHPSHVYCHSGHLPPLPNWHPYWALFVSTVVSQWHYPQ